MVLLTLGHDYSREEAHAIFALTRSSVAPLASTPGGRIQWCGAAGSRSRPATSADSTRTPPWPGSVVPVAVLTRRWLAGRRTRGARAVSRRARTDDPPVDPTRELVYFDVIVYNLIGDRDEALRRLAAYLAANPQDRPMIAADQTWAFRGLRDDPKFKALVQAP